jgi:MinD superfamily P-loop ATPase
VINKYDLSPTHSELIEKFCQEQNLTIGLKIPFTEKIVHSIVKKKIPSVEEKEFFKEIGFFEFIETLT